MIDVSSLHLRNYTPASPHQNAVGSTGSILDASGRTPDGGTSASTIGPATVVDLSDRAKAAIEQNRIAKDVADRLAQQVAAMKDGDAKTQRSTGHPKSTSASKDAPDIYSSLASATKWEAGAPYGDPTKSDAQFLKDSLLPDMDLTAAGWTEEDAQAFKGAIQNGTIKIQKASEIEGLNFKSWQAFVPNSNNGVGYDSAGGTSQNPIGDVKKAIDSHRAMAMWTADRGDVYLSW